ncbi:MAG: gliding motility-associated C-terminal domain-containing protein [Bacteroidetes bacterium]|nr:gliding motility-associated C-terminal domain-containing protein [Bacteroidota bacterium]
MKNFLNISLAAAIVLSGFTSKLKGQAGVGPAPYCFPQYSQIPCNQPGPSNSAGNFINDFINSFNTSGGLINITNNNSGCNAQTFAGQGIVNYFYQGCTNFLQANPGQVITCNMQSGNIYSQGFAVFVDWNMDGVFNLTNERVVTTIVPPAATFVSGVFTVPLATVAGNYRLRVRCAYATPGTSIDPCTMFGYGETEDYNLFINSAPPGVITATATSNSPLCSGNALNLSVASTATAPLTYTWTGPNSYSTTTQNPTIANAQASVSGVYSVVVSAGACPITKTVNVVVTNYPTYTVTPLTATVCQGGVFTPSVILGTLPGTPCSTVGVGPVCASPPQVIVGAGTTANSSWQTPSPYNKYYYDHHQQIIYRASELQASGVQAGYLTSIGFNVQATNGVTGMTNFTIKMKCTTNTTCATFDNTGLTQVFQQASFTPVNGWNTHTFATPYYWDGTSNILIDICRGNTPWTFVNSSVFLTNVGYQCTVWGGLFTSTGSSCGGTSIQGSATDRPNTRWGNCPSVLPQWFNYLWTQGPGIAAPTATSTPITTQPITGSVATVFYSIAVTPTVMNCPTIQQLTVTVVNPLSPTITPLSPMCNTFPTVAIAAVPGGGTWTTNGAISAGGIVTPALASIGTSTVLYAVGIGSCIATNTANISVSQFNTAAFSASVSPMCVTSPIVNLNSIVQSTVAGVWSGTNVSGTYSFNPSGLATNTYALLYNTSSTPVASVCPASNTMVISVLNPPQPVINPIGPYCNTAGNVQVVVNPTTGTWTPVSYQSASGVFSPSMAAIGSNTVQYVIGTFTCNTQATSTINVEAFVPATITGSITDKCNTASPVNLTPLTANNLGTWSGPGVGGTNFNPATSGVGILTLTYSTNSAPVGLCPDQSTLSVHVFSLATPVLSNLGPFCNMNGNVQIPVSPIGGTFFGINTNAISQLGVFAPTQANIGANVINYSITSGPCIAIAQTTISVEAFVSADFSKYTGPFCRNDAPVNLNSIAINPGGFWAGPGVTGSMFSPANANVGNGNIVIYFTNSVPTLSLCPDTSAIRIQVNDIPSVNIVSNTQKGCLPFEVIFNTPSTNSGTGEWNFGDGSQSVTGLNVTHQFTTPGSYTVSLSYQDDIGCSTTAYLQAPINAYETPRANFDFSPDDITIAAPDVQFNNLSTVLGNNTYQWQIGNMYQLNEVNPKVTFPKAGDYNVILTATTVNGCKDEISKVVSVKNDYGVYIPSSFTPNFDGLNDVFKPVFSPYGLDLKVYDLEVFDRWGHSLFHTKDFMTGWDGTVKGSADGIKEDNYIYKIKYKDVDGKIHNKTGHVTLMK